MASGQRGSVISPRTSSHLPRPPTSASFLRATAEIEWGVSFVHAVQDKYVRVGRIVSVTGAPPPPAPHDASATYVATAYATAEEKAALPKLGLSIETLDVSYSLLPSWAALAEITMALPCLTNLHAQ